MALAVGARLYLLHAVTIGTVFMFMQYAGMMAQPIVLIGLQLQQFQTASASLTPHPRPAGDRAAAGRRARARLGARSRRFAPRVAFEHVDFAYRADAPVLRDVSLDPRARRGARPARPHRQRQDHAHRGCSSASTTPPAAAIALDGHDIRDATLAELRGRIGLVTQEVQLFDASVRDNATLFDPTVPDARIVEVLTDLGLGDWLARQPLGLDTVLVAGGGLSAGEAQLLAFARVFLKDPGLVVLDEASSRLDPVSDRLIERALDKLLGGRAGGGKRTAIIIAHKLSTVGRADRICILEHGRVLEAGEREALVADPNSAFARLLATGAEEALA